MGQSRDLYQWLSSSLASLISLRNLIHILLISASKAPNEKVHFWRSKLLFSRNLQTLQQRMSCFIFVHLWASDHIGSVLTVCTKHIVGAWVFLGCGCHLLSLTSCRRPWLGCRKSSTSHLYASLPFFLFEAFSIPFFFWRLRVLQNLMHVARVRLHMICLVWMRQLWFKCLSLFCCPVCFDWETWT